MEPLIPVETHSWTFQRNTCPIHNLIRCETTPSVELSTPHTSWSEGYGISPWMLLGIEGVVSCRQIEGFLRVFKQ